MFTLLLLAAQAAGEWVEISQNHYRKEPPRRVTLNREEAANRIYTNFSITERPWNLGVVTRIPNKGNIRRVQLPVKAINTLAIGPERVPSTGNTNSFRELDAFGVRAPNINNRETNIGTMTVKRKFSDSFKVTDENAIHKEKSKIRPNMPPKPFNPLEKSTSHVTSATFQEHVKQEIKENEFKEDVKNGKPGKIESNRNVMLDKGTITSTNDNTKTEVTNYIDLKKTFNDNNVNVFLNSKETKSVEKVKNNTLPDIRSNAKNSNEPYTKEGTELKDSSRDETGPTAQNHEDVNKKSEQKDQDEFQNEESNLGSKTNTVEVIMKVMKVVTDNISRNTRRSFRSKMRYLEDLRNNILANIEDRIEQAWPDDSRQSTRRRREARGHVEFPSSESALMTISFLTFAVFLIKLVLQVIHTYKNKTMMVTPTLVAAVGRAAGTFTQRKDF